MSRRHLRKLDGNFVGWLIAYKMTQTLLTHSRVPGQEKGTSENEVPGFVGAFTQTQINTRLVVPDRARRMRMSETHTRTYEAPKS